MQRNAFGQLYHRTTAALRADPPAETADRLRRALRRPGPMAEVIRRSAVGGNEEALAAWAGTGRQPVPADRRAGRPPGPVTAAATAPVRPRFG